jgi:hypothetical protein
MVAHARLSSTVGALVSYSVAVQIVIASHVLAHEQDPAASHALKVLYVPVAPQHHAPALSFHSCHPTTDAPQYGVFVK